MIDNNSPYRNLLLEILHRSRDKDSVFYRYNWRANRRVKQSTPEGNWRFWLILAGRGWGKTRTGAEWLREKAEDATKNLRFAIIGETAADVRDVMIEGPSGILNISPPWFKPFYNPSKRRLTWPNGCQASTFSGDAPNQLRGPQYHYAWVDEPAKYRYLKETWDNLEMGLRLGTNPQAIITGTPKPIRIIKDLIEDIDCVVTRGNTYENKDNLAASFIRRIGAKYEGTRIGRQEVYAEILEELEGALWSYKIIDDARLYKVPDHLEGIVVGVDPPGGRAEAGIVTVGVDCTVFDTLDNLPEFYVLDDMSLKGTPTQWATKSINSYKKWAADTIVAEINFGGDMVVSNISTVDARVPVEVVRATRGKKVRAQPVVNLYEQGRVHHIGSYFELEEELTEWIPGVSDSPNRLDALVWAVTYLLNETQGASSHISII